MGQRRQTSIRSPNLTNTQHNARKMYRHNDTRNWMRCKLTTEDRKYLRCRGRKKSASRIARAQRQKQAEYDKQTALRKKEQDAASKVRKQRQIDNLKDTPLLTEAELSSGRKLGVVALRKQLAWYKKVAGDGEVPAYSKLEKEALLREVAEAIRRFEASNGRKAVENEHLEVYGQPGSPEDDWTDMDE